MAGPSGMTVHKRGRPRTYFPCRRIPSLVPCRELGPEDFGLRALLEDRVELVAESGMRVHRSGAMTSSGAVSRTRGLLDIRRHARETARGEGSQQLSGGLAGEVADRKS